MRRFALALVALVALALPAAAPEAQPNPCTSVNIHPNPNGLNNGQVGQAYSERIWLTPANPFFTVWTVTPSVPVPGLTLSPGPGAEEAYLVGTPTATGTYTFTVDAGGVFVLGTICHQVQTFTVTIL